jgi:protoheme ferro-lyase
LDGGRLTAQGLDRAPGASAQTLYLQSVMSRVSVRYAMRYGNPSMRVATRRPQGRGFYPRAW